MRFRNALVLIMVVNFVIPIAILGAQSASSLAGSAEEELGLEADVIAHRYDSFFKRVEDYCCIIGREAEDIENNRERYPDLYDPADYLVEPRGALVSTQPSDIREKSDVWVSRDIRITREMEETLGFSKNLERIYTSVSDLEGSLSWIYTCYESGVMRIYPYANNRVVQPSGSWDPRTYHFYTVAKPENNPEKGIVWTDLYWDTAGLGWMITCSKPLYTENEEFFGVQCIDVTINAFLEQTEEIKIGGGGYVFLLNERGNVIAYPDIAATDLGLRKRGEISAEERMEVLPETILTQSLLDHKNTEVSTAVESALAGNREIRRVNMNGEKYLILSPIKTVRWVVGVTVPVSEVMATVRRAVVFAVLIAFMVSLLLSFLISRKLSEKVEEISMMSRRITEGDLSARAEIKSNIQEISSIAESMNTIIERLQERVELKTRVETMEKLVKRYEEYIGPVAKTIAKGVDEGKEEKDKKDEEHRRKQPDEKEK